MPKAGSSTARGYGAIHQKLRAKAKPMVEAGLVTCYRCKLLIEPGQPWDLGHDDQRPGWWAGPEHAKCNRSAGAVKGNRGLAPAPRPRRSRKW